MVCALPHKKKKKRHYNYCPYRLCNIHFRISNFPLLSIFSIINSHNLHQETFLQNCFCIINKEMKARQSGSHRKLLLLLLKKFLDSCIMVRKVRMLSHKIKCVYLRLNSESSLANVLVKVYTNTLWGHYM